MQFEKKLKFTDKTDGHSKSLNNGTMINTLPILFCISIDFSGVSIISDLSCGDWNLTPSSVISAKANNETIWNPPLSWNDNTKLAITLINLCIRQGWQLTFNNPEVAWRTTESDDSQKNLKTLSGPHKNNPQEII